MKKIHSPLRRIFFPFYSVIEIGVFIVLELLVLAISFIVVPEYYIWPLIFGFIGWQIVSDETSPSQLRTNIKCLEDIKNHLSTAGYISEAPNHRWVPAAPKILRWPYNKILISKETDELIITGPANSLLQIQKAFVSADSSGDDISN